MNPLQVLSKALGVGETIIERVWPDPKVQAEQAIRIQELELEGNKAALEAETRVMLAQIALNTKDAESGSILQAGWRPAIGWAGAFALIYQFILYNFLLWLWAILQASGVISADAAPPPAMDAGPLFAIVTALLGVGTMRSYDKKNGIDTKNMGG